MPNPVVMMTARTYGRYRFMKFDIVAVIPYQCWISTAARLTLIESVATGCDLDLAQLAFATGSKTVHPAATEIRFLKMYCPSSVGAKGTNLNVISGKMNNGRNVLAWWNKNTKKSHFMPTLNKKLNPMVHSKIASQKSATFASTQFMVILMIDWPASSSAGLMSGKNFRKPKKK